MQSGPILRNRITFAQIRARRFRFVRIIENYIQLFAHTQEKNSNQIPFEFGHYKCKWIGDVCSRFVHKNSPGINFQRIRLNHFSVCIGNNSEKGRMRLSSAIATSTFRCQTWLLQSFCLQKSKTKFCDFARTSNVFGAREWIHWLKELLRRPCVCMTNV